MSACSCFFLSSFSSSACWVKTKEPKDYVSGNDSNPDFFLKSFLENLGELGIRVKRKLTRSTT